MKKIAICTGGFDPIHAGHIKYLEAAKKKADILVVGLNSDQWLERKKGKAFMSWKDRMEIIRALRCVDYVLAYDDSDDTSLVAITEVRNKFPLDQILFCNGGDRTKENIPELSHDDANLKFVFGVGGKTKVTSSSQLLRNWDESASS